MVRVSPRTPNPPRVLIVDDQPSFRGMARKVLEWRGYAVAGEADSGAAAIAAAESLAPDAVLLDVCLGEDSGFDVACTLTQARPDLAVLLVSSIDYRQCEPLLRACGARGFVLKCDLGHADLAAFWPACGAYGRSTPPTISGPDARRRQRTPGARESSDSGEHASKGRP